MSTMNTPAPATSTAAATTAAEVARRLRLPRTVPRAERVSVPDPTAPERWRNLDVRNLGPDHARPALAAVFDRPHGDDEAPTVFDVFEFKCPGFVYTRPRLGFQPAAEVSGWRAPKWLQRYAQPGERAYACTLTRNSFALPATSPVPCLFMDYEAVKDTQDGPQLVHLSDDSVPSSRWEAWPIHPALAMAGPAAVVAAIEAYAEGLLHEVAEHFEKAGALMCLLSDPEATPEAMEGMPLADALSTWKPAKGPCGEKTYEREPVGWRSLGYVSKPA